MKKDSKKSRKLQREKAERLSLESAKGKASPDSKRGRRIHTCPHYTLVPKAYDCEWEYSKDLSPYPWNTPTLDGPLEVPRCIGVVLPGMNAIGGTLIHVEIPMLHLKYAKFRGVMNNYIRPISDTECQCSQCQKKFPIEYDLKSAFLYFGVATVLYVAGMALPIQSEWLRLGYRTILLGVFIAFMVKRDLPLRELPYVGRFFR